MFISDKMKEERKERKKLGVVNEGRGRRLVSKYVIMKYKKMKHFCYLKRTTEDRGQRVCARSEEYHMRSNFSV